MLRLLFIMIASFSFYCTSYAGDFTPLRDIAVQDGGRIKPFDTFARESLQLVYGKSKLKGKEATEVIFTWMLLPDVWVNMEIVKIDYSQLKEDLDLPKTQKYFKPSVLLTHPKLPTLIQTVNNKQDVKERLTAYDKAIQTLGQQLGQFNAISQGLYPGFVPVEGDIESKWKNVSQMSEEEKDSFAAITRAFVGIIQKREAGGEVNDADLMKAITNFIQKHQPMIDQTPLKVEKHYNSLHPFLWSWILYLMAVFCFVANRYFSRKGAYKLGIVSMLLGFALHTYGFILRVYLTGRPPVSNMYETVIWVAWGAVLFALIFEWKKRSHYMLLSAGIVSVLCMIVADFAPSVLDASLQPLEPVLRSNLWLTIHVLTITIAYAAFFLAFILGDIALAYILKGEKKYKAKIKEIADAIYRAEKIGVVLLAAGTILGGVWADYSWGRFWGWDPKETWALIALLGYLALLHAKQGGHVRQAGLIAGSVVAFSLVIMAWYGVNYVLGAGLHSYGFGGGGLEFVSAFVGAHFLYVAFVMAARNKEA